LVIGTNSTYEQPPEVQSTYCFLDFLVVVFFFVAVLVVFFLVETGFFLGAAGFFLVAVTFLVDALAVAVVFLAFLVVVVFLAAGFFLVVVVFLVTVFAFLAAGFFALGLAVKAFLASTESLYEALTFTRSPSVTPLARAAFITCFLISFCKWSGWGDRV